MQVFSSKVNASLLTPMLFLTGYTSTLARDDVKRVARVDGHCAGSEWVHDSPIAVLPVPIVMLVTPMLILATIPGNQRS